MQIGDNEIGKPSELGKESHACKLPCDDDDDGSLGSSPKALILAKTQLFDPVLDH